MPDSVPRQIFSAPTKPSADSPLLPSSGLIFAIASLPFASPYPAAGSQRRPRPIGRFLRAALLRHSWQACPRSRPTDAAPSSHPWPGNVRELESVIHTAALDCEGQWIRPIDIPALSPHRSLRLYNPCSPTTTPTLIVPSFATFTWCWPVEGNKLRAAKLLGISRSTLHRLLEPNRVDSSSATS